VRPLQYRTIWLAGGILLVLAVILGSVAPSVRAPLGNDKLTHLTAYLALAVWFGGVYRPARYPWVAAALLALGGGIELVQGMLSYRSMEIADMVANSIGVIAGILLSWILLGSWCQWIEARLPGSR
jgi:VanZ family protein